MFCEKCGKEIKEGNNYCTNCGTKINTEPVKEEKNSIKIKFNYLIIGIIIVVIGFIGIFGILMLKKQNDEQVINGIDASNITNTETQQNTTNTNTLDTNKELNIDNLNFNILICNNTDIKIEETWKVTSENTNTLFKTFKLDNNKYKGITDVTVSEILDNEEKEFTKIDEEMYHLPEDNYYGLVNSNGDFEIAFGANLQNETKKFKISYTVETAIQVYNDCAELYWQFIGEDFSIPISSVNGTITSEMNTNFQNIECWGHSEEKGNIMKNEDKIQFNLQYLKQGDGLELRLILPKEEFKTANVINKDMLNQIYLEETNQSNTTSNNRI